MSFVDINALTLALGLCVAGAWVAPSPTLAQSVREAVKQHVKEGIDRSKERQTQKTRHKPADTTKQVTEQPREKKPKSKTAKPVAADKTQTAQASTKIEKRAEQAGSGVTEEKTKLPFRVLGEDLQIDIKFGLGYRGWVPQQYPTVDVDMAGYLTWMIEAKARIFNWLTLHRAYYESTGLSGPRTQGASVAARIGSFAPGAAWLLGVLGFPYFKIWEPIIRYESRAFNTRARPQAPGVCLVTEGFEGDLSDCPRTTETLRIVSGFETLVAGVRYNHNKDPSPVIKAPKGSIPPLFFGIGLMSYSKPYQVTIDGETLEELLFDGRFRGAGLAFGTELGGGVYQFYADADVQVGLGEVSLTEDLTLNELAPEGWLIGYVKGDATVGYCLPLWRFSPTLMFIPSFTGGGAFFFFFETEPESDGKATTPAVNWDFLWTVRGALVLAF
ncbi:MAG: hypothetical protein JXA30_04115 [Deltaproteobacteria bacterium]|nr:hypothetical protein [Deltaproteobacteria bacterium]